MIIDSHVHIGSSLFGQKLNPDDLLLNSERLNIEKSVLIPMKPKNYRLEPENDFVRKIRDGNEEKFFAFGRVDPWQGIDAEKEVVRIFEELKLDGLFLNPWEENFSLVEPLLRPVLEIARRFNKPVMLNGGHVRVSHPAQIEYIAKEFPDITFIATSGGQINICGMLMFDAELMLKACPNVIMETSGIYRRDFIEEMTHTLGANRIIFGSGTPYYNTEFEMERIKTANLKDEEKEKIFGGNLLRLLDRSLECKKA